MANGMLSDNQLKKFNDFLNDQSRNPFYVCSDSFDFDVDKLQYDIMKLKPDIVFIDGVYLLKVKGQPDRFKKAPIIADTLKKIAKTFGLPVICSTQLNREAFKLKLEEMNETHFVLSDAFIWNVDAAFIMGRTKEERKDNIMHFKTVKIRKAQMTNEYMTINWDFYNNDFSECIKDDNTYTVY